LVRKEASILFIPRVYTVCQRIEFCPTRGKRTVPIYPVRDTLVPSLG